MTSSPATPLRRGSVFGSVFGASVAEEEALSAYGKVDDDKLLDVRHSGEPHSAEPEEPQLEPGEELVSDSGSATPTPGNVRPLSAVALVRRLLERMVDGSITPDTLSDNEQQWHSRVLNAVLAQTRQEQHRADTYLVLYDAIAGIRDAVQQEESAQRRQLDALGDYLQSKGVNVAVHADPDTPASSKLCALMTSLMLHVDGLLMADESNAVKIADLAEENSVLRAEREELTQLREEFRSYKKEMNTQFEMKQLALSDAQDKLEAMRNEFAINEAELKLAVADACSDCDIARKELAATVKLHQVAIGEVRNERDIARMELAAAVEQHTRTIGEVCSERDAIRMELDVSVERHASAITKAHSEKDAALEQLATAISNHVSKLAEAHATRDAFQAETIELKAALDVMSNNHGVLQEQSTKQRATIVNLQTELQRSDAALRESEEQKATMAQRNATFAGDLETARVSFQEAATALVASRAQLAASEQRSKDLQSSFDAIRTELAASADLLADIREKCSSLERCNIDQTSELEANAATITALRNELASANTCYENEREAVANLRKELRNLGDIKAEQDAAISSLQEDMDQQQKDHHEALAALTANQVQLRADLELEHASLVASLRSSIDALQQSVDAATKAKVKLTSEHERLSLAHASLQQNHDKALKAHESTSTELQTCHADLVDARASCAELSDELRLVQNQLVVITNKHARSQAALDLCRGDNANMENQLRWYEHKLWEDVDQQLRQGMALVASRRNPFAEMKLGLDGLVRDVDSNIVKLHSTATVSRPAVPPTLISLDPIGDRAKSWETIDRLLENGEHLSDNAHLFQWPFLASQLKEDLERDLSTLGLELRRD